MHELTGTTSITLPPGVDSLDVELWGARGDAASARANVSGVLRASHPGGPGAAPLFELRGTGGPPLNGESGGDGHAVVRW